MGKMTDSDCFALCSFQLRFEFASNEFMNDMALVTLETASTETGIKDFIVVGTTINRGEDLAAKGAVGPPTLFYTKTN